MGSPATKTVRGAAEDNIMGIVGFIVHTLPGSSPAIEKKLGTLDGITTYGIHNDNYIVAVADAPINTLETLLNSVKNIDGVLTSYVTSFHSDDELE